MPPWKVRTGHQQDVSLPHHGPPPQKCLSVSSWCGHQYLGLLSFLDTKPTTLEASVPSPPLIRCNLVTTHWNISPGHKMANTLFPMRTLFPSLYGSSPKCLGKAQIPEESHPARRSALEFGSSADLDLNLCCAKLQGFGSSNYFLTCLLRLTQYSTCVYAKSLQSCLFVTPWTVVCFTFL